MMMKMKNEQNIEQREKKVAVFSEQSAVCHPERSRRVNIVAVNSLSNSANSLKLEAHSSMREAHGYLEEYSTVKHHSKIPQRRDCICNASIPVISKTGKEAEELAFRACELLLIN